MNLRPVRPLRRPIHSSIFWTHWSRSQFCCAGIFASWKFFFILFPSDFFYLTVLRNVRKTKISLKNDQQNSRKNSKEDKFTKETDKQSSSSTPQPQSTPIVENVDVIDQQQPSTSAEDKSSNNNESTDVLNESLPEVLPPTETGKSVPTATYINNRLKILYVPRLNEDIYRPGALSRAQKVNFDHFIILKEGFTLFFLF